MEAREKGWRATYFGNAVGAVWCRQSCLVKHERHNESKAWSGAAGSTARWRVPRVPPRGAHARGVLARRGARSRSGERTCLHHVRAIGQRKRHEVGEAVPSPLSSIYRKREPEPTVQAVCRQHTAQDETEGQQQEQEEEEHVSRSKNARTRSRAKSPAACAAWLDRGRAGIARERASRARLGQAGTAAAPRRGLLACLAQARGRRRCL